MTKLLIAGDFFISDSYKNHQLLGDSIKNLFASADFRIVNQEAPITSNNPKNKILKTGPHLQSQADTTIPFLNQLNVDIVTLANNHIMDYGPKGLADTFDVLNKNKTKYVGAGNNINAATKPLTIESDGLNIAILNFAENEWASAESDKPGANPLDVISNVQQIVLAKAKHDKVIVIIHGGHEYYNLPSPRMIKQYRFYVDNGADAIIGHHTHCISGYEVYQSAPIFYSLGNMLFTIPSKIDAWYTGLILKLDFLKDQSILFELVPIKQEENSFTLEILKSKEKDVALTEVSRYNNVINNSDLIMKSWQSFLKKKENSYLAGISPIFHIKNRYLRAIFTKLSINNILLSKSLFALLLNLVRCEAHSELLKEILQNRLERD